MKGLGLLGYAALNVGQNELQQGIAALKQVESDSKLPLISANIMDKDNKPVFSEFLKVRYQDKTFVFVGFVALSDVNVEDIGKVKVDAPDLAAARVAKKIRKGKNDLIVLLVSMDDRTLDKVLQSFPGVDIVVCANIYRFNETPTMIQGVRVVSETRQNKSIRGLNFNITKGSLSDAAGFKVALETKYDKNAEMDGLVEAYNKALAKEKFKWPRPKDAQPIYAGAKSCAVCHPNEFERWSKGPHKEAIQSLVREGQEYNPSCLNCHVTGYERENGFWDIETSMDMAGVQCEQCHGALAGHVQEENELVLKTPSFAGDGMNGSVAPVKKNKPVKAQMYICSRCHTDKYVLKQPAEEKWKVMGHSRQQPK